MPVVAWAGKFACDESGGGCATHWEYLQCMCGSMPCPLIIAAKNCLSAQVRRLGITSLSSGDTRRSSSIDRLCQKGCVVHTYVIPALKISVSFMWSMFAACADGHSMRPSKAGLASYHFYVISSPCSILPNQISAS